MILCSCNVVAQSDMEQVILELLSEDEWQLITPGLVYHAMRIRGKCCGCFPGVIDVIITTTQQYHREQQTPEAQIIPFITRIREEHQRCETARRLIAMRRRKVA
ncbi:MAG: (2Fe-2S)-binding protein [Okeania sp. SIO3H1]|nr:(2Fe-2S)-binding protein [Okeania sp. SIO3H1]